MLRGVDTTLCRHPGRVTEATNNVDFQRCPEFSYGDAHLQGCHLQGCSAYFLHDYTAVCTPAECTRYQAANVAVSSSTCAPRRQMTWAKVAEENAPLALGWLLRAVFFANVATLGMAIFGLQAC